MKKYTLTKAIEALKDEASDLREWMYGHCTPDTPVREFEKVANRYAIIQTKIYQTEIGLKGRLV